MYKKKPLSRAVFLTDYPGKTTTYPEAGDGIKALCLLYTPFLVLAPFLEVLKAPIYGNASLFSVAVMGAFCLFNWAVCWFTAKEEEQEVRP